MKRSPLAISNLQLPDCPIPRPGDSILWYADTRRVLGELLGHGIRGRPIVKTQFGNLYNLPSFNYIRILDPDKKRGPNWDYLDAQAKVRSPHPNELSEFNRLLSQRTPPGPQYRELITEVWARGFEIFLVGGTVRDVIANKPTNDVDLVTTIPLTRAIPLLKSMYRHSPDISHENGFVRLGGNPGSGDPFIDVKMFAHHEPGTRNAMFGNDFTLDLQHRDFACNAIYYDPINEALIDPSGLGIANAEDQDLCLVCDIQKRAQFHLGQISIRFFKFTSSGFSYHEATATQIRDEFLPALAAMHKSIRIRYLKTQLLSKRPIHEHESALDAFRETMVEFGAEEHWDQFFGPYVGDILEE